ncbi:MAG: hypothetical protein HQK50_08625 [Oligoflexia bacterium]|nr:hypothetical protein [Oligoflexia bacterium]MBF0365623.1 hypothetical protein [Oligoflexia bacterium]
MKSKAFFSGASLAMALLLFSNVSMAVLPADYQSFTADEKRELLWDQIEQSRWSELPAFNNSSWSSILKSIRALTSLGRTFDHQSDEMPAGRAKFIHTYGTVAQVDFIPTFNHPYTGMYQTGASGLVRLSLAASPTTIGYTPGMAVKFLVDGVPSLNFVAMHSLEGQKGNWNFFAHDFSNKIPEPTTWVLWALGKFFELTRSPATDLPIDHIAEVHKDGEAVAPFAKFAPQQIILRPSFAVAHLIAPESREDMRISLEQIAAGTTLYYVYGITAGEEILIGSLVTRSEFIASAYGDKELFFQHKR